MPTLGIEMADVGFGAAVANSQGQVDKLAPKDSTQGWPAFASYDGRACGLDRSYPLTNTFGSPPSAIPLGVALLGIPISTSN